MTTEFLARLKDHCAIIATGAESWRFKNRARAGWASPTTSEEARTGALVRRERGALSDADPRFRLRPDPDQADARPEAVKPQLQLATPTPRENAAPAGRAAAALMAAI